jgi:peroxiredoxin
LTRVRLLAGEKAPDFEIPDISGRIVRASDLQGQRILLLAFLRGFL